MYRLGDLFSLRGTVGRSQYLATGLGLAMVKYSVDAGSCLVLTGTYWDPKTYLDPTFAARMQGIDHLPAGYLAFLVVWALPFLWIGVAMSARRARDAGLSQWMGLGFLLPSVAGLRTVLGGATGPALVPVLQSTGVAQLVWAVLSGVPLFWA